MTRQNKHPIKSKNKITAPKRFAFSRIHKLVGPLTFLAVVGVAYFAIRPNLHVAAQSCTVSSILVNSCRPWLGAESNNYGSSGFKSRIENHEARVGRKMDIVHDYRAPGDVLSSDDITMAKRADTIALINWKPSNPWVNGDGSNATVNAQIDAMANSIKSLGSTKIMLTVFHEPENDISPGGAPNCPTTTFVGNSGSVTDYVNMWRNVRNRFDALGVTNVVWVMNYMGYNGWDCVVKDLWPGNDLVDWVMWDPYSRTATFNQTISVFYNFLSNNTDATHAYTSKPWGLGEWGIANNNQATVNSFYDGAKVALEQNTFPRLKAWVMWDNKVSGGEDYRLQYTAGGVLDQGEQDRYNAFALSPLFTNSLYAAPTPAPETAPTPTPTPAPSQTTTPTPASTPTSTTPTSSLPVPANDTAANATSSKPTSSISAGTAATDPIAVTGTLKITPSRPNAALKVSVDGKSVPGNKIDTKKLTDGVHSVKISEDGVTKTVQITVDNPWPLQMVNQVRANPIATTAITLGIIITPVALYFVRPAIRTFLARRH